MKLSMWILADWLESYQPNIDIKVGSRILRGVRMFSSESVQEPHNVYVGRAKDFFNHTPTGVICAQGSDILLIEEDDVDQVFNDILRAFDYYNAWEKKMRENIENGLPLQKLIDDCYLVLDIPFLIYDSTFTIRAFSPFFPEDSVNGEWKRIIREKRMPPEVILKFRSQFYRARQSHEPSVFDPPIFEYRLICTNLFHLQKYLGSITLFEFRHIITTGRIQLASHLGILIERWIARNPERRDFLPEASVFQELLEGIIPSKEEVNRRLELLSWKESDQKLILCVSNRTRACSTDDLLYTIIEQRFFSCYTVLYKSSIVVIANLALIDKQALFDKLIEWTELEGYRTGISYPFTNIMDILKHYRQAEVALRYGSKRDGSINTCENYAYSYACHILREHLRTDINHPALLTLREHDAKHHSDLYNTLLEYLRQERNLVLTAEALSIHRNSLVYRVKKIEQMIQVDLNNPEIRCYLLLCYRLIEDAGFSY